MDDDVSTHRENSEQTDWELIELCRKGGSLKAKAFNRLVKRHKEYVFRLALSKLKNRDDAEDATQETFIRVWFNIEKFRGDSSFKTWLTTIAMNVCLTLLLTQKRRGWRVFVPSDDVDLSTLYSAMITHEQEGSFWAQIGIILRRMTPDYRKVFILKYFKNVSMEGIATKIGSTLQGIKKKIQRAKQQFLRIYFDKE